MEEVSSDGVAWMAGTSSHMSQGREERGEGVTCRLYGLTCSRSQSRGMHPYGRECRARSSIIERWMYRAKRKREVSWILICIFGK